jgi:hypothetical protein
MLSGSLILRWQLLLLSFCMRLLAQRAAAGLPCPALACADLA